MSGAAGPRTVRGTQSFVGVMAAVWKRPSLTGMEVAWRWAVGITALGAAWLGSGLGEEPARERFFEWVTLVRHHAFIFGFNPQQFLKSSPVVLGVALLWSVVSALGGTAVLLRLDGRMQARRGTYIVLAAIRVIAFWILLDSWLLVLGKSLTAWVSLSLQPQEYGGVIAGFAVILFTSIMLFLVWACTSWIWRLAPILAMARGLGVGSSLRAAWCAGPLRGKVMEINLVMGIVKVALLVMAMVLSASPLPFANRETQTFLVCWWAGAGLLWVVFSDYFHVVRLAAYVTLMRAYEEASAT